MLKVKLKPRKHQINHNQNRATSSLKLLSFFKKILSKNRISEEVPDYVFIGLGNPGDDYCATRHNIGFVIIDEFNKQIKNKKSVQFSKGKIFTTENQNIKVFTVKPETFMNCSGEAVVGILNRWDVRPEKILVIVDDFTLPVGTVRLRRNGSHGGHNGLKSIIKYIGSDFPRLRIGIGPLPENTDIINFVLGKFNPSEIEALNKVLKKSCEILSDYTTLNIETVMNKYN